MKNTNVTTIKAFYTKQAQTRKEYVDEGIECCKQTIPSLFYEDGSDKQFKDETFQSTGAKALNHLASKLLLTLFPPNSPFFRLDNPLKEDKEASADDKKDVEEELTIYETSIIDYIEQGVMRPIHHEGFKLLISTGNVLFYYPAEGGAVFYNLHNYIVVRDHTGFPYRIITKDKLSYHTLTEELKAQIYEKREDLKFSDDEKQTPIEMYRDIFWDISKDKWVVRHEINDKLIKYDGKEEHLYEKTRLPFIPLRFIRSSGDNYGRGFITEYKGDLTSLNSLQKAIIEGAAIAAKMIALVEPNSSVKKKHIAESKNGEVLTGKATDVSFVTVSKNADFSIAKSTSDGIKLDVKETFLMKNTRDAERVTTEEIREDAAELETSLGGIYSALAHDFQLPLVNILMGRTLKETKFKYIPKGVIPKIITGIEALGRGNDARKLKAAVADLVDIFGIDAVNAMLNAATVTSKIFLGYGINPNDLVKDQETIDSERQNKMAEQLMGQFGSTAASTAGQATAQNLIPQGE